MGQRRVVAGVGHVLQEFGDYYENLWLEKFPNRHCCKATQDSIAMHVTPEGYRGKTIPQYKIQVRLDADEELRSELGLAPGEILISCDQERHEYWCQRRAQFARDAAQSGGVNLPQHVDGQTMDQPTMTSSTMGAPRRVKVAGAVGTGLQDDS